MLDLSHPMSLHIFKASGLIDSVKVRGQRMSVSPSEGRIELLSECLPLFAGMRELARSQFCEQAAFLIAAIDEYEAAVRDLAALGGGRITEDRRDGTGSCPLCGTAITHYPQYRIVLCRVCNEPLMTAHDKLDSSEGFATWLI